MPKLNKQTYTAIGSFLSGAVATYVVQSQLPKQQPIISDSAAHLSKELLTRGWRPIMVKPDANTHPGIPPIYVSVFKPSLTASTGYGFIKRGDEFFVLLNKQKRSGKDGSMSYVADVPCGFYNSEQHDLAATQGLVHELSKARVHKKLTTRDVQSIAVFFSQNVVNKNAQPSTEIDTTAEDNARRELREETGFSPKSNGQLINVESVNRGMYWYHRFYFLDEIIVGASLPDLKPAIEEDIAKSCWVNARDIHFNFDDSGKLIGGTALIGGETLVFKQADKTALNLAYAMNIASGNSYGVQQNPGQSYEDPQLQPQTIGISR